MTVARRYVVFAYKVSKPHGCDKDDKIKIPVNRKALKQQPSSTRAYVERGRSS